MWKRHYGNAPERARLLVLVFPHGMLVPRKRHELGVRASFFYGRAPEKEEL